MAILSFFAKSLPKLSFLLVVLTASLGVNGLIHPFFTVHYTKHVFLGSCWYEGWRNCLRPTRRSLRISNATSHRQSERRPRKSHLRLQRWEQEKELPRSLRSRQTRHRNAPGWLAYSKPGLDACRRMPSARWHSRWDLATDLCMRSSSIIFYDTDYISSDGARRISVWSKPRSHKMLRPFMTSVLEKEMMALR